MFMGFTSSGCEVILFLSVFLCLATFFSCDSSVLKFELLENVCGIVFVSVCSVWAFSEL